MRSRDISVDEEGFTAAMAQQKAEARKAWVGSGEAATDAVWFGIRERVGPTEFLGYAAEQAESIVTALLRDGRETERLAAGETGQILLNQTPFYGESGGQVGDTGTLTAPGVSVRVTDTGKKLGDLFVHDVEVVEGSVTPGMALVAEVDHARRRAIRANHSATHLLHEALRQVLGPHIAQKGSLVDGDRLRFDFSHQKPISAEELAEVEEIANRVVLQNEPVVTRLMAIDDARASGARALFGEKYGDEVRVVSMGRARRGEAPPTRSIRSNSAAAPMRRAPATSASYRSSARARSGPASAASRPARVTRRGASSTTTRRGCAISRGC